MDTQSGSLAEKTRLDPWYRWAAIDDFRLLPVQLIGYLHLPPSAVLSIRLTRLKPRGPPKAGAHVTFF